MATAWEKWLRKHYPGLVVPEAEIVPAFGRTLGNPLPTQSYRGKRCPACMRRPRRHSQIYCPVCDRSGWDSELSMQLELSGVPTAPIADPDSTYAEAAKDNPSEPLAARPEWAAEHWHPRADDVDPTDQPRDTAQPVVAEPRTAAKSSPRPGPANHHNRPARSTPAGRRTRGRSPDIPGERSEFVARLTLGQARLPRRRLPGSPDVFLRGGLDP